MRVWAILAVLALAIGLSSSAIGLSSSTVTRVAGDIGPGG
jgi:hypothetical protein